MIASITKRMIIGGASFRTFRCIWMLEELGIPYVHLPVKPGSPEVLRHNPLGKIPVFLDDDGFAMYESAAINTFLGDKYRENCPSLVPLPGTHLRGQYEQTISVITCELDSQGLWIQRKHESLGDIFTHIPSAVQHAQKYFNKTNRSLIQQLKDGGGPYLLGEEFTAADILYVHCLDWSMLIGWDAKWIGDDAVLHYLDRCKTRRAYCATKAVQEKERLTGRDPKRSHSNI